MYFQTFHGICTIFFSDCNCSSNELLELGNNGGYHEGFSALNTPSDGSPRNSNIEIKGEPLKTLLSVSTKKLSNCKQTAGKLIRMHNVEISGFFCHSDFT